MSHWPVPSLSLSRVFDAAPFRTGESASKSLDIVVEDDRMNAMNAKSAKSNSKSNKSSSACSELLLHEEQSLRNLYNYN